MIVNFQKINSKNEIEELNNRRDISKNYEFCTKNAKFNTNGVKNM